MYCGWELNNRSPADKPGLLYSTRSPGFVFLFLMSILLMRPHTLFINRSPELSACYVRGEVDRPGILGTAQEHMPLSIPRLLMPLASLKYPFSPSRYPRSS